MDKFERLMLVLCIAVVAYHFWRDKNPRKPGEKLTGEDLVADRAQLLIYGIIGAVVFFFLLFLGLSPFASLPR